MTTVPTALPELVALWASTKVRSRGDGSRPRRKLDIGEVLAGVPEGERDTTLYRTARALRRAGVPEAVAQQIVLGIAAKSTPPFPADAALEKIDRAYSATDDEDDEDEALWQPPAAFHTLLVPPFPTDVLPPWQRDFVESLAVATQTPPDLAGMHSLAVLAAALAQKARVNIREGWEEPLPLWTAPASHSGTRKTAVNRQCSEPIMAWERDARKQLKTPRAKAQREQRALQARLKELEEEARSAQLEKEKREEIEGEIVAVEMALIDLKVPVDPRVFADDCTPEKLALLMAEQAGRIALLSSEGGPFDMMAGRYSSQMPNLDVYLKGHAGDPVRVDRIKRESIIIDSPALTLGLMVQPEVIAGLATKPGFLGRGLCARVLYSVPPNLVGGRETKPPTMPTSVREAYQRGVRWLLDLPLAVDGEGRPAPRSLELTPAALDLLLDFSSWLETQLAEGQPLASIAEWASKLVGAVARIAGSWHIAGRVGDAEPWNEPIQPETVERAIRLGQYLIPHARAAFALMGTDSEVENAKHVLNWIIKQGVDGFTKREAFEACKARFKHVPAMEPALKLLGEHGYIRQRGMEYGHQPAPRAQTVADVRRKPDGGVALFAQFANI